MIHSLNDTFEVSRSKFSQEPKLKSTASKISENDFPFKGTTSDKLKFLLDYAVLASSSRKTQPWSFAIVNDAIELYVAKSKALTAAKRHHRELIISCGAALFNLRIAIRHFGYRDVVVFPEQSSPNLLARVSLGSQRVVQLEENLMFRAILKRGINRLPFDDCELPNSLISELKCATDAECARFQVSAQAIPLCMRQKVIDLIDEGNRLQMAAAFFSRESVWHNSNNSSHDAIPVHSWEMNRRFDEIALLISLMIRSSNSDKFQSVKDCQFATKAPLMLISSRDDNDFGWLATGEALGHLLLRARIDDVAVSFFNQPLQIPKLRSRLQAMLPENDYPQVLLRLGYAKNVRF